MTQKNKFSVYQASLMVNNCELVDEHDFIDCEMTREDAMKAIRRFAASDELLEALKAIVALEKTPDDVWDAVEVVMPKMCEIANAAIAKAEVQS